MLKENSLLGKVILITGGGTGLGKAMALKFSSLGAEIIIASRNIQKLNETSIEINSLTGNKVVPIKCDVASFEDVENLLKISLEQFAKIDVVVNNAAGNFISPTEKLSNRAFDKIVDIVLKGSYNTSLAFGKHWIKEKQKGNFLNIVTTYSWTGSAFVVPSAVAKAGVLSLTKSLAVEWGKYNIRSNAIAPGSFPTKGAWERLFPQQLKAFFAVEKNIPLKRVGEIEELTNLASFLVSDFSEFINGEVITIDGGQWLKGAGQFNFLDAIPYEMWDEIEKTIRKVKDS